MFYPDQIPTRPGPIVWRRLVNGLWQHLPHPARRPMTDLQTRLDDTVADDHGFVIVHIDGVPSAGPGRTDGNESDRRRCSVTLGLPTAPTPARG